MIFQCICSSNTEFVWFSLKFWSPNIGKVLFSYRKSMIFRETPVSLQFMIFHDISLYTSLNFMKVHAISWYFIICFIRELPTDPSRSLVVRTLHAVPRTSGVSPTQWPTDSLTHWHPHSRTHPQTHSLTLSRIHTHTHSPTDLPHNAWLKHDACLNVRA